jgi:hypothetical protein
MTTQSPRRVANSFASFASFTRLFPNAKLPEDGIEKVFRRGFAAPSVQALSRIKRSSVEKRRRAAALQDAGAIFL